MALIGMISRSALQFQQKTAQWDSATMQFFAAARASCQRLNTHRWGLCPFAYCLVRDPHSCRFVPRVGQPASFLWDLAEKCRNLLIALAVIACTVNLLTIEITTKGTKTCLRKLGSSQQRLHSAWLVVWKLTCSVAPSVQQLVRLQQTRLVQIKQQQHLPVPPLACCATMQASAARHAKTFRANLARFTDMNSRPGIPLAAVLRSKDPTYV